MAKSLRSRRDLKREDMGRKPSKCVTRQMTPEERERMWG